MSLQMHGMLRIFMQHREMYDVGEYIRANCVMKNNDQLYNVTAQWHFVDNIAGINYPLV